MKEFIGGIRKAFPAGLNSEISKVHGAGDTVVVELTNTGKAFTGRDYRNEYCFIFEIEAGKIRRIREYVDMLTVKEALMQRVAASSMQPRRGKRLRGWRGRGARRDVVKRFAARGVVLTCGTARKRPDGLRLRWWCRDRRVARSRLI